MAEKKKLVDKVKSWVGDHQNELATGAGFAAALATILVPAIVKRNKTIRREERRMNKYIYDPSTQIFWKTKRRSNNMNLLIAQRRAAGEPLYKILSDLNLLK